MHLKNWIGLNKLRASIDFNICYIEDQKFLILNRDEEEILFDDDFNIIFTTEEIKELEKDDSLKVIFLFGNNWYYSVPDNIELTPFKYIGTQNTEFDITFPYLGIHGEYDLCNGSRLYKEWCQKAKFLQLTSLGICETNTLAGTLSFQLACQDAGIKSILGETVTVSIDKEKSIVYTLKLYVKNYTGWVNLLNINSKIKVFNDGFVLEEELFNHSEGLICVLTNDCVLTKDIVSKYHKKFKTDLYYQLDFVEWSSEDKEINYLSAVKNYVDNFIDIIRPVLICDSFYLDKEHGHIKKILNSIGKVGFQNQSKDQYFKSLEDIYNQIEEISPSDEWIEKIFFNAIENTLEIDTKCDFNIKIGELHLPEYEMTEEEKSRYETNEDLFFDLIDKGLTNKTKYFVKDEEEYLERIEVEVEVIKKGGFVDYFLILADIINWCKKENILTGTGRGSAAGSLISYLLDITQIDPLKFGLLFERFLNSGRLGKVTTQKKIIISFDSGPDIEFDFDEKISIFRAGKNMSIASSELQENDEIRYL